MFGEKFYIYAANHVWFPCILVLLYLSHPNKKHNLITAFLFSFSLISAWELFELLAKKIFNSYVLFGSDNGGMETLENVVILDLGNGVIGGIIGILTLLTYPPEIKKVNFWWKWLIFLGYAMLFSYFSSFSHCGNDFIERVNEDCTPPYVFPWGVPLNMLSTYLWGYFWLRRFVNKEVVFVMMVNATVFLLAVAFRFESMSINIYIISGVLIVIWSGIYLYKRYNKKDKLIRRKRTDTQVGL
tara:strand:- start:1484 stop:2209 length:726 start_codon:yes stop_codon:yes gene_type:complete